MFFFLLNTSGLSCRKARWVCSVVACVCQLQGGSVGTYTGWLKLTCHFHLWVPCETIVLLTGCVFISAVEILEIQLPRGVDVVGHDGYKLHIWECSVCLGKSWQGSVVQTAAGRVFCVAESQRIWQEIGAGRWGCAYREVLWLGVWSGGVDACRIWEGEGVGSSLGSSRAMLSAYDEAFSFSLCPRSPIPQVMRTAMTLRERTRNLLRSTEVKGWR